MTVEMIVAMICLSLTRKQHRVEHGHVDDQRDGADGAELGQLVDEVLEPAVERTHGCHAGHLTFLEV